MDAGFIAETRGPAVAPARGSLAPLPSSCTRPP
jgi:hypothetical protein